MHIDVALISFRQFIIFLPEVKPLTSITLRWYVEKRRTLVAEKFVRGTKGARMFPIAFSFFLLFPGFFHQSSSQGRDKSTVVSVRDIGGEFYISLFVKPAKLSRLE